MSTPARLLNISGYIYIWCRACYRRSFLQCFHTRLRSLCFCSAHPCRNDDHRGEKKVTCACHSNSLYLPATVPGLFPGEKKANMGTPRKNWKLPATTYPSQYSYSKDTKYHQPIPPGQVQAPARLTKLCIARLCGDCGSRCVGPNINCQWFAGGVCGLVLRGRLTAGFPGAGTPVSSLLSPRAATTAYGRRSMAFGKLTPNPRKISVSVVHSACTSMCL